MVVQHNLTAMNANRYLGINNSKLSKSLEKLSSGYAINRAGDNAAGLAVSEKMRSQIAGMTQGVKNAQDGISMVQTFEGALTETHSILQRMKILADQMGNGTYDDPVDRAAAEQEFLQLNDELDQIADTDFNGVVVLNGGKMADGLLAKDGKFDYTTGLREPGDIGGNSKIFNTVDDSNYTKDIANKLWIDLGLDSKTDEKIDITFQYDGTEWKIKENSLGIDTSKLTVMSLDANAPAAGGDADTVTATELGINGGFSIKGTETGDVEFNVVLDNTKVIAGDTVTLTFTNPDATSAAPELGGFVNDSVYVDNATGAYKDDNIATEFKIGNDGVPAITAQNITQDWADALNALNGVEFELTSKVDSAADPKPAVTGIKVGGTKLDAVTVTNKNIKIGDQNFKLTTTSTDGTTTLAFATSDGTKIGTWKIIDATAAEGTGTIKGKLALDTAYFNDAAAPDIDVKGDYNVSMSDAFSKSEAKMTYKESITLQVGARTKDAVDFTFKYNSEAIGDLKADLNCTAKGLGTDKLTISNQESANYAIDKIDQAINKVSLIRGTFGAIQNRLEHKIDNMNVSIENLTSAESAIRDTNMPTEMMNFTKQQILAQASQSMLAQANQLPQGVLSLLQ